MSAHAAPRPVLTAAAPRRIAVLRAIAALLWAAALALATADGGAPSTGVALLVAAYPAIDAVASLAGGQRLGAAVSTIAVAALAVAGLASDAGAVLVVFGAWAVASGLVQLTGAVRRRRAGSRELPMLVSGGLSALVGVSFAASAGADDPSLAPLAGYAAFGAVLFVLWAVRGRR